MIKFLSDVVEYFFPNEEDLICADILEEKYGDFPTYDENMVGTFDNYIDLCKRGREVTEGMRGGQPMSGIENAEAWDHIVREDKEREAIRTGRLIVKRFNISSWNIKTTDSTQ